MISAEGGGGENTPSNNWVESSEGLFFFTTPQVVPVLAAPPQFELTVLIILSQSFLLQRNFKEINLIIRVGVDPADDAFWVNLLELRNGQEKLSNTLQR